MILTPRFQHIEHAEHILDFALHLCRQVGEQHYRLRLDFQCSKLRFHPKVQIDLLNSFLWNCQGVELGRSVYPSNLTPFASEVIGSDANVFALDSNDYSAIERNAVAINESQNAEGQLLCCACSHV